MGAWGMAIFADDTASDVRGDFRDLIAEGLSPEQATKKIFEKYRSSLNDPDDGPPFWLGLAVTQWKCGRLLESVKAKALAIIDSGANLKRWSGDAKRRAVLEKTRALLSSPPPPATRIRKRYQEDNDWPVGELISYHTPQGKYAVLRVAGHVTGSTGKHPIIELVDWYAAQPASLDDARMLDTRFGIERRKGAYAFSHRAVVAAASRRDQPKDRLQRLGVSATTFEKVNRCDTFRPWRYFGDYVDEVFAGPKQVHPGPGGRAHEAWQAGDILCHCTSGEYLLFQMISRLDFRPHFTGAPIMTLLEWDRGMAPRGEEMASLRAALDHDKRCVHFAVVHDAVNAAPESAFERIGHAAIVVEKGLRRTASLDMAIAQARESLRLVALRRILVDVLEKSGTPLTLAAICAAVEERGGRPGSANPLAEIDSLLRYLHANAYPFERVGKNAWKWGTASSGAGWRWTP
jgi:hypothetical protein